MEPLVERGAGSLLRQDRRGSRLVRRLGVGAAVVVGLAVVVLGAAFAYLRASPAWGARDLFSVEHRAERFRTVHEMFPSRSIAAGGEAWAFSHDDRPLPEHYRFEGEERTLAAFLRDSETTGLLVARDGTILHEAYGPGYDEHALATSFSVAKAFVSALVGIAIDEGYIASVDDSLTDYVPELQGSAYDGVTIHEALTMSSGIAFDEDYESVRSDVMGLPLRVYLLRQSLPTVLAGLQRDFEPGTVHRYASSDTMALGLLISSATGRSVARYLEESIWRPAGMAVPAAWSTDLRGNELAHAFLNASLRDFARFGRLYLDGGRRDGRQIVPEDWVRASVSVIAPRLQHESERDAAPTFGYGYQWWVPDGTEGDFVAMGIWGQFIYVDPRHGIVIVKTSTDPGFAERFEESVEVFRTIARELGGSTPSAPSSGADGDLRQRGRAA